MRLHRLQILSLDQIVKFTINNKQITKTNSKSPFPTDLIHEESLDSNNRNIHNKDTQANEIKKKSQGNNSLTLDGLS